MLSDFVHTDTGGSARCCCCDNKVKIHFRLQIWGQGIIPRQSLLLLVGWSSRLPLHMQMLLLSLCCRASLGASRLQDLHLSMLPCSQRIMTLSVVDVIGSSCATLCLSLKPSDRGISFFKVFSFETLLHIMKFWYLFWLRNKLHARWRTKTRYKKAPIRR